MCNVLIYSCGLMLVLCLQLFPLVFLYVLGALRNIDIAAAMSAILTLMTVLTHPHYIHAGI